MSVSCRSCGLSFPDYRALALHISGQKKGHRRGKMWAAKYLTINPLSAKAKRGDDNNGRIPLTEEQKDAKRENVREVSGETRTVTAFCPKCKTPWRVAMEVEYINSPYAWMMGKYYARLCPLCAK